MNPVVLPWMRFAADMNGDGAVTIRDVVLWVKHAYFLPGDSLLWFLVTYLRPVARFLEVGMADYQGFFSGFVSAFAWFVALVLLGAAHDRTVRTTHFMARRARELRAEATRRARELRNRWRGKLWL